MFPHLQIYNEAATVRQALEGAGFPPGQRQRIAQSGDLKARLVPGPVVAVRRIWDPELIENFLPGPDMRIYVDHAGPGAGAAMIQYRKALEAAGYQVATGRLNSISKKEFLWVRSKL